jgi:uncharacterized protein YqfB (UPF0267 family)
MKHVGKMKNNSARIAVAYRTIPGDATSALVIGTNGLGDAYHDAMMALIESETGQQANELADVLATRRFPDGSVMLQWLHANGHLKKVPTNLVLMTPNSQSQIPLNELNKMIAEQKGVTIDELAVTEEGEVPKKKPATKKAEVISAEEIILDEVAEVTTEEAPVTASDLRSMADKLFKEAQALRKKADEIEPPKKKATKTKAEA